MGFSQSDEKEILAIAAHSLRVPATLVSGYTEQLLGSLEQLPLHLQTTVKRLSSSVRQLVLLTNELLAWVQSENTELPLTLERVDLNQLITQTTQPFQELAARKNLGLKIQLPTQEISIQADKLKLGIILQNLLENALNFTQKGQVQVEVGLQPAAQQVKISVCDTGPGIDPQDLPHIFQKFYQAQKSQATAAKASGVGLGLYLSQKIAQAHKGKIEVESQLRQGSCLHLFLPLATDS